MKRFFIILSMAIMFCFYTVAENFSRYRGVWASENAEAVVTDSAAIFFENTPSGLRAYLDVPSYNIHSQTIFADSTFISTEVSPLELHLENDRLKIGDKILKKIETFETCAPYELPQITSTNDVGRYLQEWRLGAAYGREDEYTFCEINTNRHMFVYMVNPSMTYIRAAATRNNNHGTKFLQNIRMMRNNNTGEITSFMEKDNFSVAKYDLEMDNSKFQPDQCTFCPDGSIYWSFISFTPDQILINGCGETYQINRQNPKDEYFRYKPYSIQTDSRSFPPID